MEKTGYGITVRFENDATLKLYCKSTTDPGIEANDKIELTHNETLGAKEYGPADLPEVPDCSLTAIYDLDDRAKAKAILLDQTNITIAHTKSGKQTVHVGWLSAYVPQDATTGNQPEVSITLQFKGGDVEATAADLYMGTTTDV
jgi:hypothetical protein